MLASISAARGPARNRRRDAVMDRAAHRCRPLARSPRSDTTRQPSMASSATLDGSIKRAFPSSSRMKTVGAVTTQFSADTHFSRSTRTRIFACLPDVAIVRGRPSLRNETSHLDDFLRIVDAIRRFCLQSDILVNCASFDECIARLVGKPEATQIRSRPSTRSISSLQNGFEAMRPSFVGVA